MTQIHLNLESKLSGHFVVERYSLDEDGNKVNVRVNEFDNLITNGGLNRFCSTDGQASAVVSCQVGTGSTTPSVTDSTLANFLAIVPSVNAGSASTNTGTYWRLTYSWQFGQGSAAGNLTEVGVGYSGSSGNLFSRALILDGSGNPTTLTILPTEFLTITYELRLYWPTANLTPVNTTIGGVATTVTGRAAVTNDADRWGKGAMIFYTDLGNNYLGITAYSGNMGATVVDQPTGSLDSAGARTIATYVADTFYRDITVVFGINNANFGGGVRSCLSATQAGAFQYQFEPAIAKDNTKQLTLVTRHSIARYTP